MAGGMTMADSMELEILQRAAALAKRNVVPTVKHHGRDCYAMPVTLESLKRTKTFLERTGDGIADVTFGAPQDYRVVAMMLRAGIAVTVKEA